MPVRTKAAELAIGELLETEEKKRKRTRSIFR